MKKRLMALSLAVIMLFSYIPLTAIAEDDTGSIVFEPVSPDNEYDVRINGKGPVVTIYCLQQKERWPYGDEKVPYIEYSKANPEDYDYYDLLTDEEIQIMRKLVYAGYPNDSQGYLRKLEEEFGEWYTDEMAGYVTNSAIWALMTEWGKAGSDPTQVVDYDNPDGDPTVQAAADMLLYAKGNHSVEPPESDTIVIEGSGKLLRKANGTWSTGDLVITQPAGYNLYFSLDLPDGTYAVNEDGDTITGVEENETFRIKAEDASELTDFKVKATAVAKYPTDVSFFVTNQETGRTDHVSGKPQSYQTMLYIEEETMDLAGELDLIVNPTVKFSGMKTLEGKDLEDGEFSFTLIGEEDGTYETVTNDADGEISFSEITYTEAGVYNYTVKEEATDEAGVIVDSKVYNITVTVADDDGLLTAVISGDTKTGRDLDFANKYQDGSTSVVLGGTKTFENAPADGKFAPVFNFTLSENGEVIDTAAVSKHGAYDFDSITYTEEGVHTYTVKETAGQQPGVIYDSRTYTVVVTVTENQEGQLVAAISGDSTTGTDLNFINSYQAAKAEVSFSGTKTLEGRNLAAGEFSFTLNGEDDGTYETVKNDADGKIEFSKLTFAKEGVYHYTVNEEPTNKAGVTVDSRIYNITVTVTDSGSGDLTAVIGGDTKTGSDLNFVNKYQAGSTSVVLGGTKTFENFPADSTVVPSFTFTLSENGKVIDTKTVSKHGAYDFDSITYTEAGVHTYTVAETEGRQAGVTYDSRTYTVTVTVEDHNGQLVARISGDSTTGTDLNFINSYQAAQAEVSFSGKKTLKGKKLAADEFSFTLTGEDDGIHETVKNGADGKIEFSKLTFTEAGTYDYTVKEEMTEENGVTIDSRIYNITVTVTDSGNGRLNAVIGGDTTTGRDLNFENKYQAGSTSVVLGGTKVFENFPADSTLAPVFTFTLSENGKVIDTKTVSKHGAYDFDSITYTEEGVYTYTVTETAGHQAGVSYDSRTYTVTVTVEDHDGQLVAAISGDSSTGTDLNFINGYRAAPVDVHLSGVKTLKGKTLAADEFSFTLTGEDDGVQETVKNDADGKIEFSKLTFTKAGTYAYTVKEEMTEEAGVTIDSRIYNITVTVTDSGNGHLTAVIGGDTTTGSDLNFENKYQAGSTSVVLGGTKTFENFPADSVITPVFTFTLSENGKVIDTKTVSKHGAYDFDSITYTEEGVHTYTVAETAGHQAGITYDSKTYTVTVTVEDHNGQLAAKISGDSTTGTDLDFANSYKAAPVEVQFFGAKTLKGRKLAADEFSFTLNGENDGIRETVKNGADGKIEFSKLIFTEAGTYAYTVKEEMTDEAGVTIDSKIYNITVTVTDSGNGHLTAVIGGDTTTGSDLNFENKYQAGSTSVVLGGTKTFENFPADSAITPVFTFTLSENGKVIDTKTVEKHGDYAFDSITYTEEGVHTYTVAETAGNQAGITYDSKTYTVTVTVEDHNSQLVATISGDSSTGTDLNFANSYKAAPVEVQFSGVKTLKGRKLEAEEFSFTLNGENDGIRETVKNGADGKIEFSKLTFNKAGTYTYTVKEESVRKAGVSIDRRVYNITVTVTDSGNGYLTAVIDGDTTTGSDLNFLNKYKSDGSPEGEEPEDPGEDPGTDPGKDPGTDPGKDPGTDPGKDPGTDPGKDPGTEPKTETETGDPESPKTGDDSNLLLWLCLLLVSGCAFAVTAIYSKKGKHSA